MYQNLVMVTLCAFVDAGYSIKFLSCDFGEILSILLFYQKVLFSETNNVTFDLSKYIKNNIFLHFIILIVQSEHVLFSVA